ncbi:MAG: ankyrin repeat domain-containing protein [Rickettsiales bacterium]
MESGDNKGSSTAETNKPIVDAAFEYLKDNKIQEFWGRVDPSGKKANKKNLNEYKGSDGESLLHAAIKLGREDVAKELIARGVNLYAVDKNGKTPLHYAIEKGDDKLAQQLFELAPEAAVKGLKSGEKNLLHYAAEKGLTGIAQKMAEHHPLMLGQDGNNRTPLHYAAEKGHAILAKELFKLNPYAAVLKDKDDKTPLHYAAEGGNLELAQELFNLNPGAAASKDSANKTPLHWAAEGGKIKLANTLINGYKAPAGQNQEEALADFITQPSSSGPSAGELLINAYAKNNEKGKVKSDFKAMIKLLEMAPGLTTNPAVQKVLKDTVDAEGKNILHYLDSASPILTNIVTAAPKLATQLDTKSGKSPLHYAAEKGDVALVGALGYNNPGNAVAHQDRNGNNLLHIAAAKGNKKMVEGFIKVEDLASLVALNKDGKTPRQAAKGEMADLLHAQEHKLAIEVAKAGNFADLKVLLENNENLLNAQDINGDTLLHHAAMAGKNEIVTSLLDRGADITAVNGNRQSARAVVVGGSEEAEKCAKAISAKEKQAIFAAVENGDKDLVKKLLEQNPGLVKEKDGQSRTLLHIAAEKGHADILQAVINAKPENARREFADSQDNKGKTALHYASENLHQGVMDELKKVATQSIQDNDNHKAEDLYKKADLFRDVKEGNLEKVQAFLNKEDNKDLVNGYRDKDSKSILHIAAEFGHRDIALAIIKSNPELAEQIDKKGRTPYHYSMKEGHTEIGNALVNTKGNGTDQTSIENRKRYENISDGNGKTANHLFKEFQVIKAVREGKTQELTERLAAKPDLINAKDKDGNNLLHIAIASNQMEMVGELVKDNPQLMEEKNKDGKYPIETALEKSDESAFHQVMEQVKPEDRKLLLDGDLGKNNGLYHQALAQGKLEHAEIMLFSLDNKEDRLAIVAMPNKEGKNLLHLAAEKGNDQVVSNVLDLVKDVTNEQLVALLTAQDKNGDTPLHSAAKAGNREIFEAFAEKVGAANGIDLAELEKILEEVEKKKIREIEALAKETAAENAKSASAQNISQQAASSLNQSNEQKGASYSKEDFLKGAIDSVKFTPCTGEEKKFNSNNQRAMSDPAATHLSERRNEDGSFSYKLNIVEPNSPTKLHKIEGQFGELIFNGAGEMIGAEIKDPSKLNLLGKEQREQALKLNEEKDQGMTKASVVENLGQPLVAQQQQAKTQATPASILSAPAAAANALPRQGSANVPSSYASEQQQVPGQRQGEQRDGRGRREEFKTGPNFNESELEAARALRERLSNPSAVGNGATPGVPGGSSVAMGRGGALSAKNDKKLIIRRK